MNKHREPKSDFIRKVSIHTEKAFKNVCEFKNEIWFLLYYNEKMKEDLSDQNNWKSKL